MVLWGLTRVVPADRLPARQVFRIDVTDDKHQFWLLADPRHLELCLRRPGPAEDLVVTTDSESITRWHTGRISLAAAMRADLIQVAGARPMIRLLASWGGLGAYPTHD